MKELIAILQQIAENLKEIANQQKIAKEMARQIQSQIDALKGADNDNNGRKAG